MMRCVVMLFSKQASLCASFLEKFFNGHALLEEEDDDMAAAGFLHNERTLQKNTN